MNNHKLCCIGYITRDTIITPHNTVHMPGGTAYYFAQAMRHLNPTGFHLVTAVGATEMQVVEDLRRNGIEVTALPTAQSVCFENKYGNNQNQRTQRVTALPDPFTVSGLQHLQADIIHLGSLLHDDFSPDVIRFLATRGRLSADVQGFLRQLKDEQVHHIDWSEKHQLLPYIHTLKANEQEMAVLTQADDPHEAALILADWGVKEVILTLGDQGSLIYTRGQFHEIPAYPTLQIVDATGCGDTYMTGYLYMRLHGADIPTAGRYAAAMCTIKLQAHGPYTGTPQAIQNIIGNPAPAL